MDLAATAEQATRRELAEIEPARLREHLTGQLADGSMVPGALTLQVGQTVGTAAASPAAGPSVQRRAAGVQLVSVGLTRTRALVADANWEQRRPERTDTELGLIAADVAVARGTQLLARTAAADPVVAVIRQFGRDQTSSAESSDSGSTADQAAEVRNRSQSRSRSRSEGSLERQLLELAVVAGGSVGHAGSPRLEELAEELAACLTDDDGFEPVTRIRSEAVTTRLAAARPQAGSTTD